MVPEQAWAVRSVRKDHAGLADVLGTGLCTVGGHGSRHPWLLVLVLQ